MLHKFKMIEYLRKIQGIEYLSLLQLLVRKPRHCKVWNDGMFGWITEPIFDHIGFCRQDIHEEMMKPIDSVSAIWFQTMLVASERDFHMRSTSGESMRIRNLSNQIYHRQMRLEQPWQTNEIRAAVPYCGTWQLFKIQCLT